MTEHDILLVNAPSYTCHQSTGPTPAYGTPKCPQTGRSYNPYQLTFTLTQTHSTHEANDPATVEKIKNAKNAPLIGGSGNQYTVSVATKQNNNLGQ